MKKTITLFIFLLPYLLQAQEINDSTISHIDTPIHTPTPVQQLLPKLALGLGYAGAVYVVYQNADHSIQRASQKWESPFNSYIARMGSILGRGNINGAACGITIGLSLLTKDIRLQKASFLWVASLVINDFTTNTLKNYFQRYRPYLGKPYDTFDGRNGPRLHNSFPSAHTSNTFTTATIFATFYKHKKWVPPLAYGIATIVGLSRIYNNAHWTSDVMTGAAVGFLSAKTMILVDKVLSKHHIRIYPQVGRKSASAAMIYQF